GVIELITPGFATGLEATITLTGATIDGGDVVISSEAQTAISAWEDIDANFVGIADQLGGVLSQAASLGLSLISPVTAQARVERATATIPITDATITGSDSVTIEAASTSNASVNALGVNSTGLKKLGTTAPFIVSVGYGQAETKATVTISGQTSITGG